MSTRHILIAAAAMLAAACGGGGSGQNPLAPGPGGTSPLVGTWTGTFARPGSAAAFTLTWVVTLDGTKMVGPMTVKNGSNSMTVQGIGNTSGNDSSGYTIHMQWTSNAGGNPAFPNCQLLASTQGSPEGDKLTPPFTSFSVNTLQVNYNSCQGFVEAGVNSETGKMTMTKQ